MTRGTICDFCGKFFPNDKMNRMHPKIYRFMKSNRDRVKHVCEKCYVEKIKNGKRI